MSEQPTPLQRPHMPYVAKDGTVYPTSHFHYYQGDLVICPVCDCRPCAADCPEQYGAAVASDPAAQLDALPVADLSRELYGDQEPRGRPSRQCVCGVPANSGQVHEPGCCLAGEVTAANYVDSGSGIRHVRPWDRPPVPREVI